MKSPLKIIERMVKDYPNDMELGSKIRHYIYWLKGNKDDKKNNLKLKIFSETKNLTTKIKIKKRKKRIDLKITTLSSLTSLE